MFILIIKTKEIEFKLVSTVARFLCTNKINMNCMICVENKPQADLIAICSPKAESLNIAKTIEQHLWKFNVQTDSTVCSECWNSVSSFHEFYLKVQNASREQTSIACPRPRRKCSKYVYSPPPPIRSRGRPKKKRVASVEYFDIDLTSNEAIHSVIVQPQIDVKEEENPLELLLKYELDIESDIKDEHDATLAESDNPLEENFERNEDNVAADVKDQVDSNHEDSDCPLNEFLNDEQELTIDKPMKRKKSQDYSGKTKISLDYDKFIAEHLTLSCCLCEKPMADFAELKTHFRTEHDTRGYVQCCGKKLTRRGVIVDHIHVHQDPLYFQCGRCQKPMADRRCLEQHLKNHDDKRDRIYQCNVCSKSFYRRVVFQRHVQEHIPDEEKKIACLQCDKRFVNMYKMNQHLRLVHLNMYTKICDICGKSIRGREAFQIHLDEHSGLTRPPMQCQHCGVSLTSKYGLARHIKVMHSEENLRPQTCAICSKVSPSMTAHKRHMQYMHTMERKHQCPLCKKAFKRATDLKEHMTTHTGDVLYTCPHCPKTFNSNANMHSHRKKMHRKEWEEKRRQRYQTNQPIQMEDDTKEKICIK